MLRLTPTPYETHPTLPLSTDVPVAQGRIKKRQALWAGRVFENNNHQSLSPTSHGGLADGTGPDSPMRPSTMITQKRLSYCVEKLCFLHINHDTWETKMPITIKKRQ